MKTLDEMYPQTKEELETARALLPGELERRGLTGIPSMDRPWRKYYTEGQLGIAPPQMSLSDYLYECNKDRMSYNAISYKGKKITYEELFCRIDDTARRFCSGG